MPDITPITTTAPPDPMNTDTIPGDFNEFDFLEIQLQRAGVLQQNLQLQGDEIKKNNALLTEYQNALAQVDSQISTDTSKDGTVKINVPPDVLDQMQAAGLTIDDISGGGPDYKTGLELPNPDGTYTVTLDSGQKTAAWLKDKVQALSNNSQMDMIQLQSQMNNLNQTMEAATSVLQKASDTKDKILQNIH